MNKPIFAIALILAGLITAPLRAVPPQATPIRSTLELLNNAKVVLEQDKDILRDKAYNRVINLLTKADTELEAAKNNKGSHLPVAKKALAETRTEVESAKSDASHRANAIKALEKAIKEVTDAIDVNRR